MKKTLIIIVAIGTLISCNNSKKEKQETTKDKRIMLRTDTLNLVKMTDTMVIYESTCRGCAYESSTAFAIKDSADVVKLETIETADNNSEGMTGGNISKHLIIVPIKIGTTTMKMYKFWKGVPSTMSDSIAPTDTYKIEVQN